MIAQQFTVSFEYTADNGRLVVSLDADVEYIPQRKFYIIKNFRPRGLAGPSVLPEVCIRKNKDRWIHIDSEKETDLSEAIGIAIDDASPNL
jgi:hypothetical protein